MGYNFPRLEVEKLSQVSRQEAAILKALFLAGDGMQKSLIKDKSYSFALHVIDLYRVLLKQNEFVLSKQLLRSATSIGANVEEALAGQSRADFISKMSIASKEARDSCYETAKR